MQDMGQANDEHDKSIAYHIPIIVSVSIQKPIADQINESLENVRQLL